MDRTLANKIEEHPLVTIENITVLLRYIKESGAAISLRVKMPYTAGLNAHFIWLASDMLKELAHIR